MQVKLKSKTLIKSIGYDIITEDMLNKLDELKIVGDNNKISREEAILIIDDLQQLFEKLPNLTKVSFSDMDMSNININEIIKYCPTSNINFEESDKYFNRMKKKIALLRNTTKEKLGLSGKKIISEYDVFKAIKSYDSQTKIIVEVPDINVIKKYIDSIDKLYINLIEDSEIDKLINILNKDNEKERFVKIEELKKGELPADKETKLYVFIENVTELTLDDLKRYEKLYNIKGVNLIYKSEKSKIGYRQIYANDYYDIETYKRIRQEIDEIVKSINSDSPEEYKFLELYKKLAEKISYDCEHEDDAIWEKSHSLEGGLLNDKCICEGYAKILGQICSCLGIETKFIYGDLQSS